SQLNLGHVVDAKRDRRGEGFELRSDAWGAIRAGKGIFISADAQANAQGAVLEMQTATGRLQQAGEQLEQLSADAQASQAEPADVQAQLTLLREQLDELKASVLLLSAPDGIALTSGKHLQVAAQQNLMLNAGGEAAVSVIKRLFMGVGQGLSLFVRKLGIKLIANQGPVTLQAQNDTLELLARDGLSITSTEDEISITAKKKITLNAGGSYITLDACCIEAGTEGDCNVKSAFFDYSGPASMKADHANYPKSQSIQPLLLRVPQAANGLATTGAGMPYTLLADGAVLQEGVLDESGAVRVAHQVVTRQYEIRLANGEAYQIPVAEQYTNPQQGVLANRGMRRYRSASDAEIFPHISLRDHYATVLNHKKDQQP
ncbi:DUF2345 domain-containing protein, partial [Pseudomonas sp. NPDC008258]|uniref:DUF2345 domain-containing protein n=1 Tax=Pseudomonas sp. NPDC008258 TaxID=3364418 RepID=UPI0036E1A585